MAMAVGLLAAGSDTHRYHPDILPDLLGSLF
ncbi:unnamed protein product [Staurois parvus]|uniref:Uncharacterized protein n=1 Tax=Staurois parvus TaxID=386267 RepID=A0ABN9BIN2_9NEOB|nr:unnamed protein product [Staurois parvus]